ncbi:hypothetical protein F5051DRAFT_445928 [Lentinula edodes]|nr:hypothetical protein F5051DRAFT_445928 [Lentinula edodes]
MGPAERKLAHEASSLRSEKLGAAIDDLLEERDLLIDNISKEHNFSSTRIKLLAHQALGLKAKKKASNYNILFYYKNKEINGELPSGSKINSVEVHAAVRVDEDLMHIFHNKEAMDELREKYNEDKLDEERTVSDYLYEVVDVSSFGGVVRSSLDSTAVASYFGRGPVNEFLRSEYGIGVQEFTQHYKAWILTRNLKQHGKMSMTDMAKDLVRTISRGLSEITGIRDLPMNYISSKTAICIPHKVSVIGWPTNIPWKYPQKLAVEEVRALHASWNDGKTHWYHMTASEHRSLVCCLTSEGKLDPKERKKRKPSKSKIHAHGNELLDTASNSSSDSSDDEPLHYRKKSKPSSSISGPSNARGVGKNAAQKVRTNHPSSKAAGPSAKHTEPLKKTHAKGKGAESDRGNKGGKGKGKQSATRRPGSKKSVRFITDSDEVDSDQREGANRSDGSMSSADS